MKIEDISSKIHAAIESVIEKFSLEKVDEIIFLIDESNIQLMENFLKHENENVRLEGLRIIAECRASVSKISDQLKLILETGPIIEKRLAMGIIADRPKDGSLFLSEILDCYTSTDIPLKRNARLWMLYSEPAVIEDFIELSRARDGFYAEVACKIVKRKKSEIAEDTFLDFLQKKDDLTLSEYQRRKKHMRAVGTIPAPSE